MKHIDIAKDVLELEVQGLLEIKNTIGADFERAVDIVLGCGGRVIVSGMGKSGHIGAKISATLASTGTPALFVHPAEASHGDLGMVTDKDVVLLLSNSGETSELSDIISYIKRNSIKSIAITKTKNSTLGKSCDVVLELPNVQEACSLGLAPTTSTTATLALGDCLSVALIEARGFGANDFKQFHPGGKLGSQLLRVGDIMSCREVLPLVSVGSSVKDSLVEMEKKCFGCIGITNGNVLVGMFTDGDLLRHISGDILSKKIDDVMTENPIIISSQTLAIEVLSIMEDKKISSLFVVDDAEIVGLVHFHDILKAGVA